MKARIILISFLILMSVLFCSGQMIHSFMSPTGSLSDVKKRNFSSTEAGFSIDLPEGIGGFNGTKGIQYSWRLTEGYFYVGIEDRENKVEDTEIFESETGKVVDRIFADIVRDMFATKFEFKNKERRSVEHQGHKGVEFRAVLTDTLVLVRVFWINNRAYKMAVLLTEAQKKFEPQAQTVFDSLKFFSKANTDEMIRRKVEESTPKPLPQSPVVPRITSDAEDEGLKGKVKAVFKESQFIKGEKAGSPKQKDLDEYYDKTGNFTKRIFYDDTSGFPFHITVYGYINRSRVSKSAHILYGNELGAIAVSEASSITKKRDNRYEYRYAYKYDSSKNLIEETAYDNAGKVWTRTVYRRKDNSIEEIVYLGNGRVNTQHISKVDEKGNDIENTYLNSPLEGWNSIYTYKYDEFDKEGNWTKRTKTKSRSVRGATKEEWVMAEYRTIIYY